ncbi:MAG: hypothetical protein LBU53_03715 [Zoogloeaceae bacterium]|jgi:hypothetical protein|nr:hypothetical protein [Zoogloeaceae bacterium]
MYYLIIGLSSLITFFCLGFLGYMLMGDKLFVIVGIAFVCPIIYGYIQYQIERNSRRHWRDMDGKIYYESERHY